MVENVNKLLCGRTLGLSILSGSLHLCFVSQMNVQIH